MSARPPVSINPEAIAAAAWAIDESRAFRDRFLPVLNGEVHPAAEAFARTALEAAARDDPLPPWEREYLESEPYRRSQDAGLLQAAAQVLRERFHRTFAMRIVTRVLELHADRLKE